tara:strand:- start:929 stop:1084 length:156 start_codon:yes stop_codon:yes gene_type:complete
VSISVITGEFGEKDGEAVGCKVGEIDGDCVGVKVVDAVGEKLGEIVGGSDM